MRLTRILSKLKHLVSPATAERELTREINSHLQLLADDLEFQGLSPNDARLEARRAYGRVEQVKELSRDERGFPLLEQTWQDTRFALRDFRRNPLFSLTAILTVAIGIGASTAVFSVVDPLLFRGLPFPRADRLASLGITLPFMDGEFLFANDYFDLKEHSSNAFSAVTSWTGVADCDLTANHPQRLTCAQVESTFLPVFGQRLALGQNFTVADDRLNAPKVALLSYGLWVSRFGADPKILGTTIPVDGAPTRILGVLSHDFELPNLAHVDLVIPQALAIDHFQPGQSGRPLRVFARLKPGFTEMQATQMMLAFVLPHVPVFRRADVRVVVRSLRDYQIADVKLASWVLFASTLAIMLMVCANVTNLLLARSLARQSELATRAALGAGRSRLVWQALTESTTLSLLGALPGCALAWVLLHLFRTLAPASIPRFTDASIDGRVLTFTVAITLACGLLFGLASSLRLQRPLFYRGDSASHARLRNFLTTAQVALSLILLSTAALLVESLWNLQNVHADLATEHVITANITVGTSRHSNAITRQQFFDTLAARLRSMPEVQAVAISDTVPPDGFVHSKPLSQVQIAGKPVLQRNATGIVAWRRVSPEYFASMGIPLLRGRTFSEQERLGPTDVVVLSQSLSRSLFASRSPVGEQVRLQGIDPSTPPALIVGVAADVPNDGLAKIPDPEYYLLRRTIRDLNQGRDATIVTRSLHWYDGEAYVIVRSRAQPSAVANWIQTEVAALDRTVPVTIRTMQQRMYAVSERPRFSAALLSLFSLVGLILAAGGLYGLTSFLVAQQTRAIGLKMALGATPNQIHRLVLFHSLGWTIAGAVLGLIGTAAVAKSFQSLLFGVTSENYQLFGVAALAMLAIAVAAAWIPSRRAAAIDPMQALRYD